MTANTLVWHSSAPDGLRGFTATAGSAGIVMGRRHSGEAFPVRLLRPEPTRVALVGGAWLAWLVAFRCLGAGARVEVTTATRSRWSALGGLAGAGDRLVIGGPNEDIRVSDGQSRPVVRIDDVGLGAPDHAGAPWETRLSVVPAVTETTAQLLAGANVVLLQRLSDDEAMICASSLHLPSTVETKLSQRHDDLLVVVVAGMARFVWYALTPTEEQLLGPPVRR